MTTSAFQGAFLDRQKVEQRVIAVVNSMPSAPPTVGPKSLFAADLKFDSLHHRDLVEKFSEEFCVKIPEKVAHALISVDSAVDYFSTHPKARWAHPEIPNPILPSK